MLQDALHPPVLAGGGGGGGGGGGDAPWSGPAFTTGYEPQAGSTHAQASYVTHVMLYGERAKYNTLQNALHPRVPAGRGGALQDAPLGGL